MSIYSPPKWEEDFKNLPFNYAYEDFAIGGKLVTVVAEMDERLYEDAAANRARTREILAHELAQAILDANLCAMSTDRSPVNMFPRIFIRAYLAPDSQVKLLRTVCQKSNFNK